ncbi:uncharacterized protein LOC131667552 [Phymastichus coffea]|uniref:uncharacterized protein LOC131667552 n=1 Tax=Phymastichus coffea TaxID=108790 RepID=UPI00273C822D|nr:uncharacterized protein LOC131667552 [Phymastichus coffea]
MAKSLIIFLLCLSSVYSDPEMKVEISKDEVAEKIDDTSASVKSKRYSWPAHPTPCPPHWPHYQHGWQMPVHHKVNFIQPHYVPKPAVSVIKSNSVWNNPWQQNYEWPKPSHGWQSPGWLSGWKSSGWQSPGWQSPGWQSPGWQSPGWQSGWNKPSYSYAPNYHKPSYHVPIHNDWVKPVVHQPDCPPWQHGHSHTGVVYAPQHQYHHQPQIVHVAKPHFHHPQPVHHQYHHQPQIMKVVKPLYHHPKPLYHHAASFHHPVHHLPHVEPCD